MVEIMRWQMANPMLVLMSKQQAALKRSCAGCVHTRAIEDPFGETMTRCLKGKPYGKRCNRYEVDRG